MLQIQYVVILMAAIHADVLMDTMVMVSNVSILMSVLIQLTILVIKMNDAEILLDHFIVIVQMVINKVLVVDVLIVLIWMNAPQTVATSVTAMPDAIILMEHMNVTVILDTLEMVSHVPISTNVNKIKALIFVTKIHIVITQKVVGIVNVLLDFEVMVRIVLISTSVMKNPITAICMPNA